MDLQQLKVATNLAERIEQMRVHIDVLKNHLSYTDRKRMVSFRIANMSAIDLYIDCVGADFIEIYLLRAEKHLRDLQEKFAAL